MSGEMQMPDFPWIRPTISQDTEFFWEGVNAGELRIQRCASCSTLRHPARPMCARCQSLDWDWIISAGRGTIYSYGIAHHPPMPPFSYPIALLLVELEEGTRILSSLVGSEASEVSIGLPVQLEIVEVEPGLKFPYFRLAKEGVA